MGWFGWFVVGGVLGVVQFFWRVVKFQGTAALSLGHPIQAGLGMFALAGLIYGTILWLVFEVMLGWA